jgi:hypothetical protein
MPVNANAHQLIFEISKLNPANCRIVLLEQLQKHSSALIRQWAGLWDINGYPLVDVLLDFSLVCLEPDRTE